LQKSSEKEVKRVVILNPGNNSLVFGSGLYRTIISNGAHFWLNLGDNGAAIFQAVCNPVGECMTRRDQNCLRGCERQNPLDRKEILNPIHICRFHGYKYFIKKRPTRVFPVLLPSSRDANATEVWQ
jgi:hypothetical protein